MSKVYSLAEWQRSINSKLYIYIHLHPPITTNHPLNNKLMKKVQEQLPFVITLRNKTPHSTERKHL